MRKIVLLFMAVLGGLACATAQNIKVSGTVADTDGNPSAGATVYVEGTATGTTSGADGRFAVVAPANGSLLVSFIGYDSKTVAVAGRTGIDIVLTEDAQSIDDVIVVAYGTAKKESFTGSVALDHGDGARSKSAVSSYIPQPSA